MSIETDTVAPVSDQTISFAVSQSDIRMPISQTTQDATASLTPVVTSAVTHTCALIQTPSVTLSHAAPWTHRLRYLCLRILNHKVHGFITQVFLLQVLRSGQQN